MTEKDITILQAWLISVRRGIAQYKGQTGYGSNDLMQYEMNECILAAVLDINKRLEALEANNLEEGE